MSEKKIDFVNERIQMSRIYSELTFAEFCVVFQKAWEYSEQSGFDNLKMYVSDFAQVAIGVKQCERHDQ
jgi:hypothetical protein